MKKMILVGIVISFMSFATVSLAGTVGNIAETQGGLGKFSLGIEYDGVFDRDLDFDSGSHSINIPVSESEPIPDPGESIKDAEFESNRIFAKGTLGLHPNFDIFVKLGAADADTEFKTVGAGASEKTEFDGDWDFAWGIGAKAKLYESSSGIRIMADAQYLWCEVDGDVDIDGKDLAENYKEELLYEGATSATISYDAEAEIQEWQVALYVNKTIGMFSPYAGVKYSDIDAEFDADIDGRITVPVGAAIIIGSPYSAKIETNFEADDNFGVFLGTDIYVIPDILSFNIEGRFVDETALTLGLNWKF
ncbi:MAG: hypothetical protein JRI32_06685 [Deltaproteobacteria bacterium]|nr:hypothetical protein [Deltaproteobacteria bacterium]